MLLPSAMEMNPFNLRPSESGESGEALRTLEWSALLARLAAERDLRREFAAIQRTCGAVADFANGAALVIGGSPHDAPSINPDTLANRKSTGGITVNAGAPACAAAHDARGKQ